MKSLFFLTRVLHKNFGLILFFLFLLLSISILINFFFKRNIFFLKRISKLTVFVAHMQLLIGLLFFFLNLKYFSSSKYIYNSSILYIEHIASNIIGIILITLFNLRLKKNKIISFKLLILFIMIIVIFSRTISLFFNKN